jgi:hypothetical protein
MSSSCDSAKGIVYSTFHHWSLNGVSLKASDIFSFDKQGMGFRKIRGTFLLAYCLLTSQINPIIPGTSLHNSTYFIMCTSTTHQSADKATYDYSAACEIQSCKMQSGALNNGHCETSTARNLTNIPSEERRPPKHPPSNAGAEFSAQEKIVNFVISNSCCKNLVLDLYSTKFNCFSVSTTTMVQKQTRYRYSSTVQP